MNRLSYMVWMKVPGEDCEDIISLGLSKEKAEELLKLINNFQDYNISSNYHRLDKGKGSLSFGIDVINTEELEKLGLDIS